MWLEPIGSILSKMRKRKIPDLLWIDEISPDTARAAADLLQEVLGELEVGEEPPWPIADHVDVHGGLRPDPMQRRQMMHNRDRLGGMLLRRGILTLFSYHSVGHVFLADGEEATIRAAHMRFQHRATGFQQAGLSGRPWKVGAQWNALGTEAVKGAGGEAGKLLMRGIIGILGLFLAWLVGHVLGWWSSMGTWFR